MSSTATHCLRTVVRPIDATPGVDDVLCALTGQPGTVVLESLHHLEDDGRYCIVACDPVRVVSPYTDDPFPVLADPLRRYRAEPCTVPFAAGWIGVLGYEAARYLERLPGRATEDLGLPRAWFGLYDTVAIFDRSHSRWQVAGVEWPADAGIHRSPVSERLDLMAAMLRSARARPLPSEAPAAVPPLERRGYERDVRRILDWIRAGEIYQANLTQRLAVSMAGGPRDLYRRLRMHNPANYAAWLDCGAFAVLSSSPELFLRVRGDAVLTRPIKGTRARSADSDADAESCRALLASEKDLAELAMIVDVERNDLGRACTGVMADWPPRVQSHPTVHHLVTDVRGRLRPGLDIIDLLRVTFPGGSVTGAPKIRAMEIIDELEPHARGPYCGAIGYLGFDGRAELSVAIRTMVVQGGRAYLHVGSGIVADSDPAMEFAELEAKARGMRDALSATDRAGATARKQRGMVCSVLGEEGT